MPEKKKKSLLKRFTPYMGRKKILIPLSFVLSGLSAILNIVPYVLVWYIVRNLLSSAQTTDIANVSSYAWMAFASVLP